MHGFKSRRIDYVKQNKSKSYMEGVVVMAKIDLKFMKGNKNTLKAMSTTYTKKGSKSPSKASTTKKK